MFSGHGRKGNHNALLGVLQMLASLLFKRVVSHGTLTMIDAKGRSHRFGDGSKPHSTVRLTDPSLHWKLLIHPSLHIGEAYTNGTLIVEEGTLKDFFEILLVSQMRMEGNASSEFVRHAKSLIYRRDVINRIGRARKNVQHHYDLSAKLYDQFLDSDRQYSCAYFRDGTEDIERAQLAKKQHIAAKLLLEPGMHVLDIGCGWGGLALYLARNFDVKVTGITLSDEQLALARLRADKAGLADRAEFKLLDYRQEEGAFDRIVSVGMFEHVGLPHYQEYFRHVQRLLKQDGVALIHTIGRQTMPTPINEWVRRYIFPGAYLPSLSQLAPVYEHFDLWLTDFENLRLHYAKTLNAWNERFQENRREVADIYDEKFCRMWEFYLQSCEQGFRYSGITVFQMQLAKSIDAVPLTRDYIYETERELIAADAPEQPRLAGE